MPLKLRIKPEHKVKLGTALIKNVSVRPIDILVLNKVFVERDDYKPKDSHE
jgi:hypothetical protein